MWEDDLLFISIYILNHRDDINGLDSLTTELAEFYHRVSHRYYNWFDLTDYNVKKLR